MAGSSTRNLESTIEKLLSQFPITVDDEVGRDNASRALVRWMGAHSIHPADIHVRLNGGVSDFPLIETMRQQLVEAHREIEFWRRGAEPAALEKAIQSQQVEYRWGAMLELICTRLTGDDPEIAFTAASLTHGWKAALRGYLGVGAGTLRRWEIGIELIPQDMLDKMEEHPLVPRQTVKRKGGAKGPAGRVTPTEGTAATKSTGNRERGPVGFPWADKYVRGFEALNGGMGLDEAGAVIGANYNMMSGMFGNQGPKEEWLGPIEIIEGDGPMTYLELWKIGHFLHGQGWKTEITKRYNLPRNAFGFTDPVWLDGEIRAALRQEYRSAHVIKTQPVIVKSGKDPISDDEYEAFRSLWPESIAMPAMGRFIITHTQIEPGSLNQTEGKDARKIAKARSNLRNRYHEEIKRRRQNQRYLHMSRGLAQLEKRTAHVSSEKSVITGEELQAYGDAWFGSDSHLYLAQLIGHASTHVSDFYTGKKDITIWVQQTVLNIAACVEGLDLDDPDCEVQIAGRVASHFWRSL